MTIAVKCEKCGDELDEPGALLIGPPDVQGYALKQHLCIGCYTDVLGVVVSLV